MTFLSGGYRVWKNLQVSVKLGELHYQRYLSTASPVVKDPAAQDALTATLGIRGHFKTARTTLRPGISYTRAFIGQQAARDYNVIQVDLGVAFN